MTFILSNIYNNSNLFKLDPDGEKEWDEGINMGPGESVDLTTDGNYFVVSRLGITKRDSINKELWTNSNITPENGILLSGHETTDGGYIISGSTGKTGGSDNKLLLIKTDSEGNQEWEKNYDGGSHGYSVQQTSDGGYITTGESYLIKTDSEGNQEWKKDFDDGWGGGSSVKQTIDGGYIYTGNLKGNVLIKTDSQGNQEWKKNYGGGLNGRGWSVQQTTDGGYVVTGDKFLIKTDSEGNIK